MEHTITIKCNSYKSTESLVDFFHIKINIICFYICILYLLGKHVDVIKKILI